MADISQPKPVPQLDPDEVKKFTMGFMGQGPKQPTDAELQLDALKRRQRPTSAY